MAAQYTGNSIVDYLKSAGQDSSYSSRTNLYSSSGLNLGNYTGSAAQNTALLNYLRGGQGGQASAPAPAASNPSPQPGSMTTPVASPTARQDLAKTTMESMVSSLKPYQEKQATSQEALINYYKNLENPIDRYNRLLTEQGVGQQQELVNSLTKDVMSTQDLLEGIRPSVEGRSGNFFMTSADQNAQIVRESQPLNDTLTKLLRSKQYEEVGLAGKQNLVKELLSLSLQNDAMQAKPLELGVDYSTADLAMAQKLFSDVAQTTLTAGFGDIKAGEDKTASELAYQRQQEMAKLESKLSLNNSLALKSASKTEDKKDQATTDKWNSIVASAKTEYDVWNFINNNQDALRKSGIDVDKLWSLHAALAAKTGTGGNIRSESTDYSAYLQ